VISSRNLILFDLFHLIFVGNDEGFALGDAISCLGAVVVQLLPRFCTSFLDSSARRNEATLTIRVTVIIDSAKLWSQSQSANETPYNAWDAITAGIVRNTNSK